MMENAFYFTLSPLFVLGAFNFLFRLFGHVEKRIDYKKIRVISMKQSDNEI